MAFQQKPNTGSLFKNHKKSKENQPDYSGSCLIDGKKMKIGAWLKTSKKGEKFFSMSFQAPQGYAPQANGYQRPMPTQGQKPQQSLSRDASWDTPIDGDEAPF